MHQAIYQGKLLYFIDAMVPDLNDTIKIGFTALQLKWCRENEEKMWSFFIEHKMLYNTNEKEYIRFIQDGSTTQGFPEGAPGKTGCYIGWQIIRAYMKNNDVTLQQLLNENDAQKILTHLPLARIFLQRRESLLRFLHRWLRSDRCLPCS